MRTIWKTGSTCPKGVAKRRYGNQLHSRSRHVAVRADLSDSIGLVVKPEAAAVISTAVAALRWAPSCRYLAEGLWCGCKMHWID